MRQSIVTIGLVLVTGVLPLIGCGDGNDNDVTIGTPCGDNVVEGNQQCDGTDLDGATCQSLGFASGTLACTSSCTFDTSGCSGTSRTPTPIVTPTTGEATATVAPTDAPTDGPTATAANPTATPTPGGPTCDGSESIVVTLSLDADITSARVDLGYTASANLPGSGPEASVKERVDFAGSGLTVVNDFDDSGDLVDDTLTMSLVGSDVLAAGPYATVTFDCVAGQPVPAAGDFTCTVVSASLQGSAVTPACSIAVQ